MYCRQKRSPLWLMQQESAFQTRFAILWMPLCMWHAQVFLFRTFQFVGSRRTATAIHWHQHRCCKIRRNKISDGRPCYDLVLLSHLCKRLRIVRTNKICHVAIMTNTDKHPPAQTFQGMHTGTLRNKERRPTSDAVCPKHPVRTKIVGGSRKEVDLSTCIKFWPNKTFSDWLPYQSCTFGACGSLPGPGRDGGELSAAGFFGTWEPAAVSLGAHNVEQDQLRSLADAAMLQSSKPPCPNTCVHERTSCLFAWK